MNILEFWEITPAEFAVYVNAYVDKASREQEERITLSYMQSYWTAQWFGKKPPEKLSKILGKKSESKVMSDDEMFKQIQALHKAFGGE